MNQEVNKARWIAVLAVTGLALYLCWLMLQPFLGVLLWAVVLAIIFYPVHKRILDRVRRPGISAFLSVALVIVVFITPLAFVVISLINELSDIVRTAPAQFSQIADPANPLLGKVSEWMQKRFGIDPLTVQTIALEQLKNAGSAVLERSLGVVRNLVGAIVKAFFVIFTMYYLFRDGERIVKILPTVLPFTAEQSSMIIRRTNEVISASVYGVVTIATLQGFLGGFAFWVLGVPSPILWGVVLAFVCMIPVLGSFLVWIPASIHLMLTGHWTKAILLIAWGALVISTVDNLLRPRLIRSGTKLHELFIFFSVLGGLSVFGLLGIVLGPIVLAITMALLSSFKTSEPSVPIGIKD